MNTVHKMYSFHISLDMAVNEPVDDDNDDDDDDDNRHHQHHHHQQQCHLSICF